MEVRFNDSASKSMERVAFTAVVAVFSPVRHSTSVGCQEAVQLTEMFDRLDTGSTVVVIAAKEKTKRCEVIGVNGTLLCAV